MPNSIYNVKRICFLRENQPDLATDSCSQKKTGGGKKTNQKYLALLITFKNRLLMHLEVLLIHICYFVGSLSENDTWVAKKLTVDHNTDNQAEVKRILEEHPGEQKRNIFRGDRLLGMLAPLRAFGDFRFKWDASVIKETIGNLLGHMAVPEEYKTPPYLTVEPDVFAQKITPKDKFLVIGSDGLWDMMTPMQVCSLA